MRAICFILAVLFLLFLSKNAQAQHYYSLHGMVRDTAGNPVSGATIKWKDLFLRDSLTVVSDPAGKFFFPKIRDTAFQLIITSAGYSVLSRLFSIAAGKNSVDLGGLVLLPHYVTLDNVTVSAGTPAIVFKEDTVEYKADSFHLKRKDAVVEDLLKKLPGIQVKKDGSIIAQGKPVTRIKVNGKDFFDGDLTTATRNLPANIVDKIQVIDDYGDAASFTGFKGSEPQKIINIQLKKDKSEGYFVKLREGYGPDNKYAAVNTVNYFDRRRQVSVFSNNNNTGGSSLLHGFDKPFFGSMTDLVKLNNNAVQDLGGTNNVSSLVNNQDFGFLNAIPNYGNGVNKNSTYGCRYTENLSSRLSFYASYMYYKIGNHLQYHADGWQLIDSKDILSQSMSDKKDPLSTGQRVYANIEYNPDSLFSVKFTPVLIFQHVNTNETAADTNVYKGNPLSYSYGDNRSGAGTDGYTLDLLLKRRFRKTRQSLLLEVNYNDSRTSNSLQTYNTFSSVVNDTVNQLLYTKVNTAGFESKLSYVIPLRNKQLLEGYYDYSLSRSSTSRSTFFRVDSPALFQPSPGYSGAIRSDIYSQLLGLNYKLKRKKLEYVLGFGWQDMLYTRTDSVTAGNISRHAINLLPLAQLNYQLSATQVINLKYAGLVQQPNPLLLLPITDTSNPLIIYKGNISLRPEFKNSLNLYYYNFDMIKGKLVLAGLNFTKVFNKIVSSVALDDVGKTVISYVNTGYSSDLGLYYNFSMPFQNKKYELTLGGNLYDATYAFYNNGLNLIHSVKYNQNLEFILNRDWAELALGAGISQSNFLMGQNMRNARDLSFNQRSDFFFGNLKAGWDLTLVRSNGYFLPDANKNVWILNAFAEQGLSRKIFARLDAGDLFNQSQFNYNRSTHDNYITDYRFNVVGRYLLFSLIFKLNHFGVYSR